MRYNADMSIILSAETQRLIEDRVKETGVSADELVRVALQTLDQTEAADYDELDEETRASIEQGQAEIDRGEGIPWEQARARIRARFIDRNK